MFPSPLEFDLEPYRKWIDISFWFGSLPLIGGLAAYALMKHINLFDVISFKLAFFTLLPKLMLDCCDSSRKALVKIQDDLSKLSDVDFKAFGETGMRGMGAQARSLYQTAYENELVRREQLKKCSKSEQVR